MNNILAVGLFIVSVVLNLVETNNTILTFISYGFLAIAAWLAKDWLKQKLNEL